MKVYKKTKLVCGVGVNDADYPVSRSVDYGFGLSYSKCKFYITWVNMLKRCYSASYQLNKPTYVGCESCDEWLFFSNFKAWMEKQDWHGKYLDKDILLLGNKTYSPQTCLFVSPLVSSFLKSESDFSEERADGVYYDKKNKVFKSDCCNPITGKREFVGRYNSEAIAHIAWKKRKHELACQIADIQTDIRVANALRTRYA